MNLTLVELFYRPPKEDYPEYYYVTPGGYSFFGYVTFIARIILIPGRDEKFDEMPNGQKRYFSHLMTHKEELLKDASKMEKFQLIYEDLQDIVSLKNKLPTQSEVLDIYGKIIVNAMGLETETNIRVGSALFLSGSVIDHSCVPNVIWSYR